MNLDVCLVTGMYPTPDAPHGGIFIGDRVTALRERGARVYPFALQVMDSWLLRTVRHVLRRPTSTPWTTPTTPAGPNGVSFDVVSIREGLLDKLLNRATGHRHQARRLGRAVRGAVGDKHIDVVHAHWAFTAGSAAGGLAQSLDVPLVVTCHGSDINEMARNPRFTGNVICTLERADSVEFVSQALLESARTLGFSSPRARVVPNGIWAEEVTVPESTDEVIASSPRRILYVGSLRRIKGADRLPALYDAVAAQLGEEIELTIVGSGELADRLREWGSGHRVTFTGFVGRSEVLEQMRASEVLVIPSRNEGWPTAVLEAHSQGLPVVAYDAGGTREAVGDDRLICSADAPIEELAGKIVAVLRGVIEIDRRTLARRAQDFTWTALADRTLAQYEEIAGD